MQVAEIRCYPVKSMLGEVLPATDVGHRGLAGDRLWAVRDADGKMGSGKNTRRFRRMPGLLELRAYAAQSAPIIELPDGHRVAADDPDGHRAIGEFLGRPVTLGPEGTVAHHDEGPVSVITTASLRRLAELSAGDRDGAGVGPLRFRANLLIDVPGSGFAEDTWSGRRLRVGQHVVLTIVRPLTRCVMIDMAQDRFDERHDLLRTLAEHHAMTFGVVATVERPGRIATGDQCSWL